MKFAIQRVAKANLTIQNQLYSKINKGIVVLIGITHSDTILDIPKVANKIIGLRIFNDQNHKMNLSLLDINGEILIVSQFTLYSDCTNGNRPSFTNAASPEHAKKIYNEFVNYINRKVAKVQTGKFGANMQISLVNDGPATFIIETDEK